jgi:hypothetical protein
VEPRIEPSWVPETPKSDPRPDQGILDGVLRGVLAAQDETGGDEKLLDAAGHEDRECLMVARLGSDHEFALLQLRPRRRLPRPLAASRLV